MPIVNCKTCGKEFCVKPSHLARCWGKFCSIPCKIQTQLQGAWVVCSTCGKKVYLSPKSLARSESGKYFCTKSCQTLWRNNTYAGEKSPNWTDGKSAYRKILIRNGVIPECWLCKTKDKRVLSVHHKDHNRINNDVKNLVWPCFNCHHLVHSDGELDKKVRK